MYKYEFLQGCPFPLTGVFFVLRNCVIILFSLIDRSSMMSHSISNSFSFSCLLSIALFIFLIMTFVIQMINFTTAKVKQNKKSIYNDCPKRIYNMVSWGVYAVISSAIAADTAAGIKCFSKNSFNKSSNFSTFLPAFHSQIK